ncbi:hypothetical protein BDP27DRAFT_1369978 [Rhodocollybia butyracea]|uniref:Uncharacterized protein n=1 Tax=Rhodocollybia butyracea TaxID=206335 RepID=A0A9P5PCZ8_9AGAR|nr:hypothetical protein BDP27DRAFT_1369978 [Rhodocollybia butyracea]
MKVALSISHHFKYDQLCTRIGLGLEYKVWEMLIPSTMQLNYTSLASKPAYHCTRHDTVATAPPAFGGAAPQHPLALQTTGAAPIKAKKILQDCVHKRVAKRGLIIAKSRCGLASYPGHHVHFGDGTDSSNDDPEDEMGLEVLAEVEKTWELVGEAMVLDKEEADKVLDVWTESVKLCALALLDGDEAQCILHKAHCALEKIIELGGQLAVLQGKLDKLLPTLRKARSAAEATVGETTQEFTTYMNSHYFISDTEPRSLSLRYDTLQPPKQGSRKTHAEQCPEAGPSHPLGLLPKERTDCCTQQLSKTCPPVPQVTGNRDQNVGVKSQGSAQPICNTSSHHPVPMIPKDAEGQRSGPTPGHGLPFTSDLDNDNEEETDDDNEEEDASEDNDGHPTSGKLTKGRSNLTISMRVKMLLEKHMVKVHGYCSLALRSATNCALWTIQQKLVVTPHLDALHQEFLRQPGHSVQEDSMPKKLYRLEFWSEKDQELEADEQGNVPLVTDVNGKVLAYVWDVSLWHQDFLEMDIGSDEGSDGNDEQEITPKSNKGKQHALGKVNWVVPVTKTATKAGKGKGKEREIALPLWEEDDQRSLLGLSAHGSPQAQVKRKQSELDIGNWTSDGLEDLDNLSEDVLRIEKEAEPKPNKTKWDGFLKKGRKT